MVMSVGLIAGITAGGTFAVGLVLSAALIWHLWVRQSQQGDKDVERGQGVDIKTGSDGKAPEKTLASVEAAQQESSKKPAPLDLAKEATTRDVQLQLDSPYEGPLPSEDRRAIMKASLCPESPFAAYTMYAGEQQPAAERAPDEQLTVDVVRDAQRQRVKRQNKQRQAVRLPRFSPRRHTGHGRRGGRHASPRLHHQERRDRTHRHRDPVAQRSPPRYRHDDQESSRQETMTTGLGRAALLQTISLIEQMQMDSSLKGKRTSESEQSGRPPRAIRATRHDRNQRQMYSSGEIERQYFNRAPRHA